MTSLRAFSGAVCCQTKEGTIIFIFLHAKEFVLPHGIHKFATPADRPCFVEAILYIASVSCSGFCLLAVA